MQRSRSILLKRKLKSFCRKYAARISENFFIYLMFQDVTHPNVEKTSFERRVTS